MKGQPFTGLGLLNLSQLLIFTCFTTRVLPALHVKVHPFFSVSHIISTYVQPMITFPFLSLTSFIWVVL